MMPLLPRWLRASIAAVLLLAIPAPNTVNGAPCAFKDLGSGVTIITELAGLTPFQEGQILDHVRAKALLPAQKTEDGLHETILFDTPTKGIDSAVEFVVRTSGTTNHPVSETTTGSSPCVSYTPVFCFRNITIGDVTTVEYETTWSGSCLGGQRDVILTACLNASSRWVNGNTGPPGGLMCTVETPVTDGPAVSCVSVHVPLRYISPPFPSPLAKSLR